MRVKVGTFNLNNLFSRYNFRGELDALAADDLAVNATITFNLTDPERFRIREFQGRLVTAKPAPDRETMAQRIAAMDVDVLAVQEVEDIDTLNRFARDNLQGLYPYRALIEGNDPRLIDVGILSKLPLGGVTSWRHAVHEETGNQTIFGRDLLQADILNAGRTKKLFTIFNNHLKSHFIPFGQDAAAGAQRANTRRRRQAEVVRDIVLTQTRPNSRFLVLGDMNDPPDSEFLEPFTASPELGLVDALTQPTETRQPAAAGPRLDPSLQSQRPTGPLHAHRSDLAQPLVIRQARWIFHRSPQETWRRRQRPRPGLGRTHTVTPVLQGSARAQ